MHRRKAFQLIRCGMSTSSFRRLNWDPTNDWSFDSLDAGELVKRPHVTLYSEGELIWGEEPPCFPEEPPRYVPPPTPIAY